MMAMTMTDDDDDDDDDDNLRIKSGSLFNSTGLTCT